MIDVKEKKIQKYLKDIKEIQEGFSGKLANALGGKKIVDNEKLNELKRNLKEGNLPSDKDIDWFFALKKMFDNVYGPLLQVTQDVIDGKITKEEGLVKKEWLMDPERKF